MASILDFDDATIARGLERLNRQICTPPGFDKRLLDKIRSEGLARFHEWPSGHWSLTDRGRWFLSEARAPDFAEAASDYANAALQENRNG